MYICNKAPRCALFWSPSDYEIVLYLKGAPETTSMERRKFSASFGSGELTDRDYHVRLEYFDARWYFPSYVRVSARTNDNRVRFDNPDRTSCFFDLNAPAWRWDSKNPLIAAVHYYMESARGPDCRATGSFT